MQISGAEAMVQALIEQGVEVLFGYPGGAIMPTYDALHGVRGRLRHILVRHEQGATHAAQGYARATGRPGVCLATSGPGATNLITGLTDALMDSTPIVCITGQVPGAKLGSDAFQEADVIGLTLAATKWSCQVTRADQVAPAIARAFQVAMEGRPGPVLVDVTRDAQTGNAGAHVPPNEPWSWPSSQRDLSGIARAAELLNTAQRPYLMLGHGVTLAGAEDLALAIAERAGLPSAATLLGLSAFPVDHPLYAGMLGMHGSYGANMLTNEADVILAVGMRFDDRVTGRLEDYARQARIIHVDVDPAQVNRLVPAEVAIVADACEALAALLPLLHPRRHDAWLARFREHDAIEHEQVVGPELAGESPALRMGEVVDRLSTLTHGQAVVVTDVGQHQMIAARHYRFAHRASHITSGGLGTMGFALPAAIGAAVGAAEGAAPARPVVAIAGDGGIQMTIQELGTLMQEQLPVKVVVLNNEHLGMVRQWQELFFEGRLSEVRMHNPDFVTLAAGYGIAAASVGERESLDAALSQMLAHPGPYLLEVRVGREDNVFPMMPAGASVSEMRLA
jgi:acetolactate synthase-1/2/3 large subunit